MNLFFVLEKNLDLTNLFAYMPHGQCYLWQQNLVWLHGLSDGLIGLAYYSIPITLLVFISRRKDLPFQKVFGLFGAFILSCGTGHFLEVWAVWHPIYWTLGVVKAITAVISIYTALELVALIPQFLALRSPEELEKINQKLQLEVQEREKIETILTKITQDTSGVSGREYFPVLVANIAELLDMESVFLNRMVTEPSSHLEPLAHWHGDRLDGDLAVIASEVMGHCDRLWEEGPTVECGLQPSAREDLPQGFSCDCSHQERRHLAIPLMDNNGEILGTLCVVGKSPFAQVTQTKKLLELFALRAVMELQRYRNSEERQRSYEQLEERIQERTTRLREINQSLALEIEEREKTQQALTESEQRFRTLVANIPGAVYRCRHDGDRTMEFLSQGVETMTGFPAEEFVNNRVRTFMGVVMLNDTYRIRGQIQSAIAKRTQYSLEYRLHDSHGQLRWVLDRGQGVFDQGGQCVALDGVIFDITERKQIETALDHEREQLLSVIINAPVAMAIFDRHMRYRAYSEKWLQDHPPATTKMLLGRSHYEAYPDESPAVQDLHRRALEGEIVITPEDTVTLPNGRTNFISRAIHPWYDSSGDVQGIIIVTQPINDLVKDREAALEVAALKSTFLATMSHEIRTPMNGILGMAELIQRTPLTVQQQSYVNTLGNSANHLLMLINNILDFSKLEAQEMTLEQLELSLLALVDSTLEIVMTQAYGKNLELHLRLDPTVPLGIQGDPTRLRQILTNLLTNGVKFTESGSITLGVERLAQTPTAVTLKFTVTDTGMGIRRSDLQKLFQSFSQADVSIGRKYGGTGLGLAISKQLVTLMGGDIGVNSEWGKGSEFWFTGTFPLASQMVLPPLGQWPGFQPLQPPPSLMLVSGESPKREVWPLYGQAWGLAIAPVAPGELQTLAIAPESPVDLVVVDVGPAMDFAGLRSLAQQLPPRKLTLWLLPITQVELLRPWVLAQGDFFLSKPLKLRQLHQFFLHHLWPSSPLSTPETRAIAKTLSPRLPSPDLAPPDYPDLPLLVVEDNEVNQKVLTHQLRELGFKNVTVAPQGEIALGYVGDRQFAAIFMDCDMPILDGYETTRHIRAREAEHNHNPTPIIALTAHALEQDRQKCLAVGMDDYISKPIAMEQLQQVLHTWVLKDLALAPQPDTTTEAIAPAAGHPPIDLDYLRDSCSQDEDFFLEIVQDFILVSQKYQRDLRQQQQQLEPEMLKKLAHKLKGTASTMGILTIPDLALQLETLEEFSPAQASPIISEILQALQNLQKYLKEEVLGNHP